MTIDHVGCYLLPGLPVLRYIGRLAFPIFAYLVAEGCHYTHNKARYLATMCVFGCLSQVVSWFGRGVLTQSIFSTFILSMLTIFALQWWVDGFREDREAARSTGARAWLNVRLLILAAALAFDVVTTTVLPTVLPLDFRIQYRLPGVLTPVLAYIPRLVPNLDERQRRVASLALFGIGLAVVSATGTAVYQWWSLAALVPLALYNGTRGPLSLKYFFYAYYPLHLAVIFVVQALLKG